MMCSTKRGGSILAENYLHPIEQFRMQNAVQEVPAPTKRGGLFSANSKKKIGPIEAIDGATNKFSKGGSREILKSTEFLKETSLSTPQKANNTTPATANNCSSAFSLKSKFEDADILDEQKGFVMLPTNVAKSKVDLEEIEVEARRILGNLGITDEMLHDAVPSGPRSDIIGAYRIVVHRLQRQAMLVKQAESIVIEEPAKPKNTRKVCVIL